MANGTTDEKVARAERIREQSAKAAREAEQHRKATQNAIRNLRETGVQLQPYREEFDSVSEVTLGKDGAKAKGPPWLVLALGVAFGGLALAAFVAWLWLRSR